MQILAQIISYASAAVGGVFAIFGFINGGLNRRTIFMAVMMAAFAVWGASIAIMYGVTDETTLVSLAVMNYVSISLVGYGMLMLALSFTPIGDKQFWIMGVVTMIPLLCISLAMLINVETMFLGAVVDENGLLRELVQNRTGYLLFGAGILLYAMHTFAFLGWATRTAKTVAGRKALMMMLIMGGVVNVFAMIFNLFIPMFAHDYSWGWVGTLAIPGFALASYKAVVKFAQDEL